MSSSLSTPETWAGITAALGALAVIARKLLTRNKKPIPEFITRAEFHHELNLMRDRIGAGYLAVADKLDAHHRELLAALDRQATRLNHLESGLARVDERTKL